MASWGCKTENQGHGQHVSGEGQAFFLSSPACSRSGCPSDFPAGRTRGAGDLCTGTVDFASAAVVRCTNYVYPWWRSRTVAQGTKATYVDLIPAMRIYNASQVRIHRDTWRRIAISLQLGADLPAATRDDCGLFDSRQLIVVVSKADMESEAGSYTCGRIAINACRYCSAGRLLWVFCHELVHAWFDSYRGRERFGPHVEGVADAFADRVFEALGGTIGNHDKCASYRIRRSSAAPRSIAANECLQCVLDLTYARVRRSRVKGSGRKKS